MSEGDVTDMESGEKAALIIFVVCLVGLAPISILVQGFSDRGIILSFVGWMGLMVFLEAFVPAVLFGKDARRDLKEMWEPRCG